MLSSGLINRTLWRTLFRHPFPVTVQNPLFKEVLDQRHDAAVRHLLTNQGQEAILRNRIEVALEIDIDDVAVASLEQFRHPPQRILASPFGAKAIAVRSEVPLKDGFQHHTKRRLYHPVTYRRHGHIKLHFDPVSLWVRLKSPIRFIRFAVTGLLF